MTSEPGAIRLRGADGMSAAWVATASVRPLVRVAPALAALAYPALIWAGPAIASFFLVVSVVVPAVGVVAVRRSSPSYPWSGCVALLAVASPPLYLVARRPSRLPASHSRQQPGRLVRAMDDPCRGGWPRTPPPGHAATPPRASGIRARLLRCRHLVVRDRASREPPGGFLG